jgi:hypothetical protein
MTIYAGLIAALLNPFDVPQPLPRWPRCAGAHGRCGRGGGCVESLTARLRMRTVPPYLMLATAPAGTGAGLAGSWRAWHDGAADAVPAAAVVPVFFGRTRSAPFWLACRPGAGLDRRWCTTTLSWHAGRLHRGAGRARAARAAAAAPRDPRRAEPNPT